MASSSNGIRQFLSAAFYDQERYAYVIRGPVGLDHNIYDEKTTHPVHAGTVAIDKANTVHWDGSAAG
jgi:hypothetical protein